jgi:lipopolysaccharide transport system ATP-binding protein
MKPILEVENLTKTYKLRTLGRKPKVFNALKGVSFKLEPGTSLGIFGRNGSGKSTLLKILAGVAKPTSGSYKVRGSISAMLELGNSFHPELSGIQNIFLYGAVMGFTRSEIKKHLEEILDFAEIDDFVDHPIKYYSSGMRMRLAFSVASHLNNDILILDEVLAVGDPKFTEKCIAQMRSLNRDEGRTFILVSHQFKHMKDFCQRGIEIKEGEIISDGPLIDVARSYYNRLKVDLEL